MRVLLDENLDHALRNLLAPHDVITAAYMGWSGLKNGELLEAAENSGIEVLLTGDQTLMHEQNLARRRLAIVRYRPFNCQSLRTAFLKLLPLSIERCPACLRLLIAANSPGRRESTKNRAIVVCGSPGGDCKGAAA